VQDFFEHPQHSAALKFDEVMLGHIGVPVAKLN